MNGRNFIYLTVQKLGSISGQAKSHIPQGQERSRMVSEPEPLTSQNDGWGKFLVVLSDWRKTNGGKGYLKNLKDGAAALKPTIT